jgi:hypothetical protein
MFRFPNLESVTLIAKSLFAMCNTLLCAPLFENPHFLRVSNPDALSVILSGFRHAYPGLANVDMSQSSRIRLRMPSMNEDHVVYINPPIDHEEEHCNPLDKGPLSIQLILPSIAQLDTLTVHTMQNFGWNLMEVEIETMDCMPMVPSCKLWSLEYTSI